MRDQLRDTTHGNGTELDRGPYREGLVTHVVDKAYTGGKPPSPEHFLGYAVVDRERGRVVGIYEIVSDAYAVASLMNGTEPRRFLMEYRDATISKETRDQLFALALSLAETETVSYDEKLALREVIERWDANSATAINLTAPEHV